MKETGWGRLSQEVRILATIIRILFVWVMLAIRDVLWPSLRLSWAPELGLALLAAASEWVLVDGSGFALPPLGRALQASLAVLAILVLGLQRLSPWMPGHPAILTAVAIALGAGFLELLLGDGFRPRVKN